MFSKHVLEFVYFEECSPGYAGPNCTIQCPYPSYGDICQGICKCDKDTCDISTGCAFQTTGILFRSKTKIKSFFLPIVHCI